MMIEKAVRAVAAEIVGGSKVQNVVALVIFAALLLYPLWIIFRRAGLDPRLSLLVLIPYVGTIVVAVLLGAMKWKLPGSPSGGEGDSSGNRPGSGGTY